MVLLASAIAAAFVAAGFTQPAGDQEGALSGEIELEPTGPTHVYWANHDRRLPGAIGRARIDGTQVDQSFVEVGRHGGPIDLALDDAYIYWTVSGTLPDEIGRVSLDGTAAEPDFITDLSHAPTGLTVDDSHIYWTNWWWWTISRANLDGSGLEEGFVELEEAPTGIAVDGSHIYWAEVQRDDVEGRIGRADLDGGNPDREFIVDAGNPWGVAVDDDYVYWADIAGDSIGRANLDGSDPNPTFITETSAPAGLAVDDDHIYWSNWDRGTIGRADLDGSDPDPDFITGATNPIGVVLGAGADPPPRGEASPSELAFPATVVGEASSSRMVSVTNAGAGTLRIEAVELTGDAADQFESVSDSCTGSALGAGEQCRVEVRFAPTSLGLKTASLEISHDAASEPETVALRGEGGGPTEAGVAPETVEFDPVPAGTLSAREPITVTNLGGGTLTLGSAVLTGDDAASFEIIDDNCAGETLELRQECRIGIRSAPRMLGSKQAELVIPHDAMDSPATVALAGEGAPHADPAELRLIGVRVQGTRPLTRHLSIRGWLNPAASGERLEVSYRAAGQTMTFRPRVNANGRIWINRRITRPARRAEAGTVRIQFPGNRAVRAARQQVRAAQSPVRLEFNSGQPRIRGNRVIAAGKVRPRARREVRVSIKFNRRNGTPARIAARTEVGPRGRWRVSRQTPPAVREFGAWVSVAHPGRGRFFGQRIGSRVGGDD